jgi:CxxC motif-containing protein (DUF1111 family)
LDAEQCDDLTDFVANLPRPVRVQPTSNQQAVFINNGEQLFHSIRCAACHVQKLGEVDDLFSDLLLHDMGSGLQDPLPAIPKEVPTGATQGVSVYGGRSFDVFVTAKLVEKARREWRTPPLWGVADSAPYLHDGRAANLDEAIRLHGGEANASAARYRDMTDAERGRIVAFLQTLRAPSSGMTFVRP